MEIQIKREILYYHDYSCMNQFVRANIWLIFVNGRKQFFYKWYYTESTVASF